MTLSSIASAQQDEKAGVARRHDKIEKSFYDKREYRGLELTNGVKALLVSDPAADKASAAMDVHVGYLADPVEYPGLAHFCEHMLFLGTTKYPLENDYSKFLNSHGGSSNAYTDTDHTNYHFEVAPHNLDGALDRFVQFFLSPLFTESATEREVNAVDSEHRNNLKADNWRLIQLERSLSRPGCVYNKFGTGSKETLLDASKANGVDLRDELIKFHSKNYSSNIMSVAIVGKNSLDELEEMLLSKDFSKITNKNITPQDYDVKDFYTPSDTGKKLCVVPIQDVQKMQIAFPQKEYSAMHKSMPSHYLSHLLGHEGDGTILKNIREKGWATSLNAGGRSIAKGTEMFVIEVTLSNEGLKHTDQIVELIFSYIGMLKKEGPQKWIYDESESISETKFRFKDAERPLPYATSLALKLQNTPMDEILTARWICPDYEPQIIMEALNNMSPANMNYIVHSKEFKDLPNKSIEPIYETEYTREDISKELVERCNAAMRTPLPSIHLPRKNIYIPTNFDLVELETVQQNHPVIIKDEPIERIWFKQDDEFRFPKALSILGIYTATCTSTPLNTILSNLYASTFILDTAADMYDSDLAGYTSKLSIHNFGLLAMVHGYSQNLGLVSEDYIGKLVNYQPSEKNFNLILESTVRSLKNFGQSQPYAMAMHYSQTLLNTHSWSKVQLLAVAEEVTYGDLIEFIPQFWKRYCLEYFYYGNFTRSQVINESKKIEEIVNKTYPKSKALFSNQLVNVKEYKLPKQKTHFYRHYQDTHDNNAIHMVLQTGSLDVKCSAKARLMVQMLEEPCYNELRTQKQLGYIVHLGKRGGNGSNGLQVVLQGDKDPSIMVEACETFFDNFRQTLVDMKEEDFKKHVQSQITELADKPKTMNEQGETFYNSICDGTFHFDVRNDTISILKNITHAEMIEYFDETIARSGKNRRELTTIVHKKGVAKDGIVSNSTHHEINSTDLFKTVNELYGGPKPHVIVPPLGLPY
uniref:Insulin-degrading enzyme n=1 Tax=Rhabditophanes sp. KR3021 TaxID=114890 RepID=A0AC35TSZ0_9BILA